MESIIRSGIKKDSACLISIDSVAKKDLDRIKLIDEWLNNDTVYVAELDGRIVGYGVYNQKFFHQGNIEMLMIAEEYRGRKIGEQLLLAIEKVCETSKLFTTTNLSNQRMQRLLTRSGFKTCGFINELDPNDPELVFVKVVKI